MPEPRNHQEAGTWKMRTGGTFRFRPDLRLFGGERRRRGRLRPEGPQTVFQPLKGKLNMSASDKNN